MLCNINIGNVIKQMCFYKIHRSLQYFVTNHFFPFSLESQHFIQLDYCFQCKQGVFNIQSGCFVLQN